MIMDLDSEKVTTLLSSLEKNMNEYNNYIDLFFKELLSNSNLTGEELKSYQNYINSKLVEYLNFGESFKKYISTTRYCISDLENKAINSIME